MTSPVKRTSPESIEPPPPSQFPRLDPNPTNSSQGVRAVASRVFLESSAFSSSHAVSQPNRRALSLFQDTDTDTGTPPRSPLLSSSSSTFPTNNPSPTENRHSLSFSQDSDSDTETPPRRPLPSSNSSALPANNPFPLPNRRAISLFFQDSDSDRETPSYRPLPSSHFPTPRTNDRNVQTNRQHVSLFLTPNGENNDDFFTRPSSDFLNFQPFEVRRPTGFQGRSRLEGTPYKPVYVPFLSADGSVKPPARYDHAESINGKSLFNQNAISLQKSNQFDWKGRTFHITVLKHMMNGQFKVIAKICPEQPSLLPGIENNQLLVTTFRDHCIMVKSGSDKIYSDAHLNVLAQQQQLVDAKVPVVTIYNREEAKENCGFFIVEYIPYPFELSWNKGTKISSMTREQLSQLDQVRDIFKKTYDARIIADLQPNNLRIRDNGELTLVDLRENEIDEDDLEMNIRQMLKSFACEKGDEIYAYLNPII